MVVHGVNVDVFLRLVFGILLADNVGQDVLLGYGGIVQAFSETQADAKSRDHCKRASPSDRKPGGGGGDLR